jgi:hypothetical protein
MRQILAGFILIAFTLTGCASIGGPEGFTTRVLAGLTCVSAITAAGAQVSADPDLGFATATDALNAINKIASGPGLQTALSACQDTFRFVAEDTAGLLAMTEAKAAAPSEPPAQRKARMSRNVGKAQAAPVKVLVPLR